MIFLKILLKYMYSLEREGKHRTENYRRAVLTKEKYNEKNFGELLQKNLKIHNIIL